VKFKPPEAHKTKNPIHADGVICFIGRPPGNCLRCSCLRPCAAGWRAKIASCDFCRTPCYGVRILLRIPN
jgi:hypothetical protein